MPKFIHDRAERIQQGMGDTYGPEKARQVAFALATQQAHRLGKSPKKFKSKVTGKMEPFGTPEGRREAKQKLDRPLREYRKTAASLETNEGKSVRGINPHRNTWEEPWPSQVNDVDATIRAALDDRQETADLRALFSKVPPSESVEVVVPNPTAADPKVPVIKAASSALWRHAFDELVRIGRQQAAEA